MKNTQRYKLITLGFMVALAALVLLSKECSAQSKPAKKAIVTASVSGTAEQLQALTNVVQSTFSVSFSPYEQKVVKEHDLFLKQWAMVQKDARRIDSTYQVFLREFFVANKIDLTRLSGHPDSLKISSEGTHGIYKPQKK